MDLSNEESIKECLTKTINAFGELNVVVNGGHPTRGLALKMASEEVTVMMS